MMALQDIVGPQQILITTAFLGAMLLILFILRSKSKIIRETIKGDQRINIIEDTAISQTERLRLVEIDDIKLVILSTKAHAPVVCQITKPLAPSGPCEVCEKREDAGSNNSNLSEREGSYAQNIAKGLDQATFARKIESWRR